jgi:VWFA-related protein
MKCSRKRIKIIKASAGQADLRRRNLQLLLIFILTAFAYPQEEPTFHSQSNVVIVPALVRDKSGEIVYGLQAKDFVIEDNGVEQAVHLDEAAEAEPLSLMIAIQTGGKAEREFPRIRGLKDMLDPILAQNGNQIAIVTFDSQPQLAQDFTSDVAQIDQVLQHLQPGDGNAAILDTVNYCVGLLNKLPQGRQRVLLLISETRDHGSRWAKIDDVVTLMGDSNTTIYSLVFSPAMSNILDTERGTNTEDMGATPDLLAVLRLAHAAMEKNTSRAIADQTGGEYELFESRKRFESRMIDFTNHLHSRYLLSFQPNDPQPGLHRIRVKLKQPNGSTVLARGSYWAEGPTP